MTKIFIILLIMMVNTDCQIDFKNKEGGYIVGGQDAKIRDFPYMVILRVTIKPGDVFACGGSYIHEMWVLTATHCIAVTFKTPPEVAEDDAVELMMGVEKKDQKIFQKSVSVKVIAHSKFFVNSTHCFNDIALIKIERPFQVTPEVGIGKLLMTAVPSQAEVTAIGWGATKSTDIQGSITPPRNLQRIDLSVWRENRCIEETKSRSTICVGEKGKIPCFGDSGGPLVYGNKIVGVSSWGRGCYTSLSVYEGVYNHLSWIKEVIKTEGKPTSDACNLRVTYIIFFIILCSNII